MKYDANVQFSHNRKKAYFIGLNSKWLNGTCDVTQREWGFPTRGYNLTAEGNPVLAVPSLTRRFQQFSVAAERTGNKCQGLLMKKREISTSRLSQGILSATKDSGLDPKLGTNLCMSEGSIQEKSYPQSLSEIFYPGSRAGGQE